MTNLKTGVTRKQSTPNFRKINISYPLICTRTCAYQEVRNVCFSENLACLVFLYHPFRDSPFCLITDKLNINLFISWKILLKSRLWFIESRNHAPKNKFIELWSFESGYNAYVTWKIRSSWLWEKNPVYSSFSERKFWDCTCYSPISFLLLWATLSSAFTQQEFREGSLVGLGAKFRIGRFPV